MSGFVRTLCCHLLPAVSCAWSCAIERFIYIARVVRIEARTPQYRAVKICQCSGGCGSICLSVTGVRALYIEYVQKSGTPLSLAVLRAYILVLRSTAPGRAGRANGVVLAEVLDVYPVYVVPESGK